MTEGNGAAQGGPQPIATLVIQMFPPGTPGGNIRFSAPDDEILGRGMLDKLRASLDDYYRAKLAGQEQRILPAAGMMMPPKFGKPV